MNDAKSMLIMYSYAATKAAEDKEDKAKDDSKQVKVETNAKAAKADKQVKTSRRGKKNDKGREGTDCTITKE